MLLFIVLTFQQTKLTELSSINKYLQLGLHFVFNEKSFQWVWTDFCQFHQIFILFTFTKLCYLVISPNCYDLEGLTPHCGTAALATLDTLHPSSWILHWDDQVTRSPVQSCILLHLTQWRHPPAPGLESAASGLHRANEMDGVKWLKLTQHLDNTYNL